MYIGEIIKEYRTKHNLSMQEFADRIGTSKAYISLLEKIYNPKNNKPISPTMDKLQKIAEAMNLTTDELLNLLDKDQPITIKTERADGLTKKDEKDILKTMEKILAGVEGGSVFAAHGGTIEDEVERELFKKSLLETITYAKKIAKKKFTPKKYRK